jgi:hypothetical protein
MEFVIFIGEIYFGLFYGDPGPLAHLEVLAGDPV